MLTAKINKLSQDVWHCATLQDVFEKEFFEKIRSGLPTIKWMEAKKKFYIQREENLKLNKYYQDIFSKNICDDLVKKLEFFFGEKFESEFEITAHQMLDGDYIGIHTDANPYGESHRLTLLLNEAWHLDQGGILLTLSNNNLKNIRDAWLPIANTGFIFEINEKSYHAVTPIKGNTPRYSIVFTFKKLHTAKIPKSIWSSFPFVSDVKHATSTAKFMGIDECTFHSKYTTKLFGSTQDFLSYVDDNLDNAPTGLSYKNGRSINVDQNGLQSKGTDKDRVDAISNLKRIPPIILVRKKNGVYALVDGSHRLSYAKDNEMDICAVIYQEKTEAQVLHCTSNNQY